MKILKIELESMVGHKKSVGSMIEAAEEIYKTSTYETTVYLEDKTKIIFHRTDCSNGRNEVTILLPDNLEG